MADTAEVIIRPEAGSWGGMLRSRGELDAEARRFRQQMGLPVDRPVLLSGHQAQVWHPGILAKYLAVSAAATRLGCAGAWLVVDQDVNEAVEVRFPVKLRHGTLVVERWPQVEGAGEAADVPVARRAPVSFSEPGLKDGAEFGAPHVGAGLGEIRAALEAQRGEVNLARQVAGATDVLVRPLMNGNGLPMIFATDLARTDLFGAFVERMRAEPERIVWAYNEAARAFPRERIAALAIDEADGNHELPLWRLPLAIGSPRRRVRVNDLKGAPIEELSPRALLMTGLLRLAGCDLFVHGTGGGGTTEGGHAGYDRITERWFELLGMGTLAPTVMVTATMLLRIDGPKITVREIERASWLHHRAMHDPAVVGDAGAAGEKAAMVAEIRAVRKANGDARTLYRKMHGLLDEYRHAHATDLLKIDRAAANARGSAREAAIAGDRTWAFPLYEKDQLVRLREEIGRRFGWEEGTMG